ncbi:unnamed protein product [Rhizoctonia solani]|uniref:Uncharacterized protein n=1 Tax=Rhizoctonia solani TaxID=456999 RepID=A0A8H3DZ37_9AGAM|nr:unnamed protein product [Rhizoctonia solani]
MGNYSDFDIRRVFNALALEYTASYNPHAGSLITFAQFLLVALVGLKNQLYVAPPQPTSRASLIDELAHVLLRERKSRTDHTKVGIQSHSDDGRLLNQELAERIRTLSPVSVIRSSDSAFGNDPDAVGIRSRLGSAGLAHRDEEEHFIVRR